MRRFRRRNRGMWFPLDTGFGVTKTLVTTAATGFAQSVQAIPLIAGGLDQPPNVNVLAVATQAGGLALTLNSAYLTKRIVGSVFAWSNEAGAGAQARYAFFGIIVDRVTSTGVLANAAAWNPFGEDSQQKRWLFRRVWRLQGSGAFGAEALMSSNSQCGSVKDGPSIDCKMKARVTYEERLFGIFAVQNEAANSATNTQFAWSLRMFATPIQRDNR